MLNKLIFRAVSSASFGTVTIVISSRFPYECSTFWPFAQKNINHTISSTFVNLRIHTITEITHLYFTPIFLWKHLTHQPRSQGLSGGKMRDPGNEVADAHRVNRIKVRIRGFILHENYFCNMHMLLKDSQNE